MLEMVLAATSSASQVDATLCRLVFSASISSPVIMAIARDVALSCSLHPTTGSLEVFTERSPIPHVHMTAQSGAGHLSHVASLNFIAALHLDVADLHCGCLLFH